MSRSSLFHNYQTVLTAAHVAQSVGYGVVVGTYTISATDLDRLFAHDPQPAEHTGVGFFFAALMLALTYLQSKFSRYKPGSSEEFTVSLVTGLHITVQLNQRKRLECFKECQGQSGIVSKAKGQ